MRNTFCDGRQVGDEPVELGDAVHERRGRDDLTVDERDSALRQTT